MPVTKLPKAQWAVNIRAKGFTLIELVIGIIVFSTALALFSSLLVPQARRSVDPIFQVRATELAQSLINEIAAKAFDEQSSMVGGSFRCNESGQVACTASGDLGPEEIDSDGVGIRQDFDDVDDYHGLLQTGGDMLNSQGEALSLAGTNLYEGFSSEVEVLYDSTMDGIDDSAVGNRKLIVVTITTPFDEAIRFSTYRSNY
jgi:MSHA pilin protein MshD